MSRNRPESAVHHAEFVADTMQNGVSLAKLIDTLGSDTFATTKRNAARGNGNTAPRRSIRQQPAVKLSREAFDWLNACLQDLFDHHRTLPHHDLRKLD